MTTPASPAENPLEHLANLSLPESPQDNTKAGSDTGTDTPKEQTTEEKLEEANASLVKLQQQLKSSEGRLKSATPGVTKADLQDLRDDILATRTAMLSMVRHSGNEELTQEVTEGQTKSAVEKAQRNLTLQQETISNALVHAVHDEEGNLLITTDQVAEVKKLWNDAGSDMTKLSMIIADAAKMVIVTEREKAKQTTSDEQEAATKKRTEEEEESGAHELSMTSIVSGTNTNSNLSPLEKMSKGLQGKEKSTIFSN
jgi:small-conductance mechanosensitive channel